MLTDYIKLFQKKWRIIFFACFVLVSLNLKSQVIWENPHAEVYQYLSRMADKGLIEFNDVILPVSRNTIATHLENLQLQVNKLTKTEKKELSFYQREYITDSLAHLSGPKERTAFFKKDKYGRWRSFFAAHEQTRLNLDPLSGMGYISGSGKRVKQYSSGVQFWGTAGKHWGFQFYFRDFNETGPGIDTTRLNTPATGIIIKDSSIHKNLNYSETRAWVTYSWKNGSVGFGQDHFLWGYGENGRIVLSDKSPVFPLIRFDYRPFPWLTFNYAHIWLNSNIIDSARTYPTGNTVYGGMRVFYQPKFMAIHSITMRIKKGLSLSLGESMIYNDHLQLPYLIPILFFKVYDYANTNSNNLASSNGQIFFQINSRNLVPKTNLYSTLFIDELRASTFFDPQKSRNQLGYTVGIERTDLLIPYFTLGLEYTKVRPFVYQNLIPAEDYTNHGYYLGDWMGNNFDRFTISARYTPLPRLKCLARFQYGRKGGAGSIFDQYFTQPQPGFLFNLQQKTKTYFLQCSYEWINNLYFNASYTGQFIQDVANNQNNKMQSFQAGISYGL